MAVDAGGGRRLTRIYADLRAALRTIQTGIGRAHYVERQRLHSLETELTRILQETPPSI